VPNLRLGYDALAQRWEGAIVPINQWTVLESVTALLTLARTSDGQLAGFILDGDTAHADIHRSIDEIRSLFGSEAADLVARAGDTDLELSIPGVPGTVELARDSDATFPVLSRLDSRSREVTIVHEAARGVVRVSMRLPWWARFLRPWVTVRRRGRPEVIALGPLKYSRGMHVAEMHYGLPSPTSSLVSEVIGGAGAALTSGVVSAVLTAALILVGVLLLGDDEASLDTRQSENVSADTTVPTALTPSTSAPATTNEPVATTSTTLTVATTIDGTATTIPVSTTALRQKPATSVTTVTTLLPPGGINFTEPVQYITSNDTRADVTVDRNRLRQGETLNVRVRITGVFINPFSRSESTELQDLVAACRALIGVNTPVPPTPGWSPNVSVSLAGTAVQGGGITTLVVVGNVARECGDSLVNVSPPTISVVRLTFYREVEISLPVPTSLRPGAYDMVLDQFDFNSFRRTTPIRITVTE